MNVRRRAALAAEEASQTDFQLQFRSRTREKRAHLAQEVREANLDEVLPELTRNLMPWAAQCAVGVSAETFYQIKQANERTARQPKRRATA